MVGPTSWNGFFGVFCYPLKECRELSSLDRLGTSRVMQTQMDRMGAGTSGREKSAIAMRAFDGVPWLGDSLNLVAPPSQGMWMSQRCLETPCYSLNFSLRQLGTHPSLPVLWIFQLEWPKQCWDLQPSTPSCPELRMGRCLECRFLEAEVNGWICLPPILSTFGLLHCTVVSVAVLHKFCN